MYNFRKVTITNFKIIITSPCKITKLKQRQCLISRWLIQSLHQTKEPHP